MECVGKMTWKFPLWVFIEAKGVNASEVSRKADKARIDGTLQNDNLLSCVVPVLRVVWVKIVWMALVPSEMCFSLALFDFSKSKR
jgi:hypothetical protein